MQYKEMMDDGAVVFYLQQIKKMRDNGVGAVLVVFKCLFHSLIPLDS